MTPTQIARRADALYSDGSTGITRRVLCDMVARREAEIEDLRSLCVMMHDALNLFCEAQDVHGENCPLWERKTDECALRAIERCMVALGMEVPDA